VLTSQIPIKTAIKKELKYEINLYDCNT